METKITITRLNLTVLTDWFLIILSLIGLLLHVLMDIQKGAWFAVGGVVSGLAFFS
jgi:hypothetical protein